MEKLDVYIVKEALIFNIELLYNQKAKKLPLESADKSKLTIVHIDQCHIYRHKYPPTYLLELSLQTESICVLHSNFDCSISMQDYRQNKIYMYNPLETTTKKKNSITGVETHSKRKLLMGVHCLVLRII